MAYLALLRRFWWAIPILGLSIALMVTRGTLADAKRQVAAERSAHVGTIKNYMLAASQREASDLKNVVRVGGEATAISERTTDEYEKRIAALRADFAERVRRATGSYPGGPGGTNLPGLSNASIGTDESTCEAKLPGRDALIASEQAEQLVALQAWVKRVAQIDVNGPVNPN